MKMTVFSQMRIALQTMRKGSNACGINNKSVRIDKLFIPHA